MISHEGPFKSACVHRDARCCFGIDHRSSFLFEKAVDWNFTILNAEASLVPRGTRVFADPHAEVFHLRSRAPRGPDGDLTVLMS